MVICHRRVHVLNELVCRLCKVHLVRGHWHMQQTARWATDFSVDNPWNHPCWHRHQHQYQTVDVAAKVTGWQSVLREHSSRNKPKYQTVQKLTVSLLTAPCNVDWMTRPIYSERCNQDYHKVRMKPGSMRMKNTCSKEVWSIVSSLLHWAKAVSQALQNDGCFLICADPVKNCRDLSTELSN